MRILHISDPHFGTREEKDAAGTPTGTTTVVHCWKRPTASGTEESDPRELARVLKEDPELASHPPDLVAATGDIGWSCNSEDYRIAEEFFGALRAAWPEARIAIVPGNHDVDLRDPGPPDEKRQDEFVAFLRRFYGGDFDKLYPAISATSERQDVVSIHVPSDELLLVGVNSAAHLQTFKRGQVVIERKVLQFVTDQIAKLKVPDTALRVFALHHHLLPFAEGPSAKSYDPSKVYDRPDPSLVANSAKLQTWLAKNQFHLVLHGHKHVSHGREDILRKLHAPVGGHKVLILGAGSSGVIPHERMHTEPLNFHIIDIDRLAKRRWAAQVHIRKVDERDMTPEARALESYPMLQLGTPPIHQPTTFCAERMDDCHRAIAAATKDGKLIRSFISIVEAPEICPVPTASISGRPAGMEQVEESFRALHPEYSKDTNWDDQSRIVQVLANPGDDPSFQFKHGYRLFGGRGEHGRTPIGCAVDRLKLDDGKSQAYVGLYDPEIDTQGNQEPIPGLMGVQFVPEDGFLDIVLTFRKIELSFWWVVNMVEASRLLAWAASDRYRPRRITFFATLAQWKTDVEATFIATLDVMPEVDLMAVALGTAAKSHDDGTRLVKLLQEKVSQTNDVNFDLRGIRRLNTIVSAILEAGQWHAGDGKQLADYLRTAREKMEQARSGASSMRTYHLGAARGALESAVQLINANLSGVS